MSKEWDSPEVPRGHVTQGRSFRRRTRGRPHGRSVPPSTLSTQVFSNVPAAQGRLKSYLCDAHPGKQSCLSVYGHSPGFILILRCVVSRWYAYIWAWQMELVVKNLSAKAGDVTDTGSIPGSGRPPGGGHGTPLQYPCLENPHGQRSVGGLQSMGLQRDRQD